MNKMKPLKKSTVWKIGAFILLIAVCLPLIPKVVPATEAAAVSTVVPLPYAMEKYGQNHSNIYSSAASPKLDGELEEYYTPMGSFDDQVGNFSGVFVSETEDGTMPAEPATEFVPDLLALFGTYDEEYVYLYIQTMTRTAPNGYGLKLDFGFNFGASQKDAREISYSLGMNLGADESEKTEENYIVKTKTEEKSVSDSTGTYQLNTTVYECKLSWDDVAPDGKAPEKDFDRFYLSCALRYFDGEKDSYWIYGVPNTVILPSSVSIGSAFGAKADAFSPNVVNLMGARSEYTAVPTIVEVDRVDKNTNKERTFDVTISVKDVAADKILSAGVIFTENVSSLNEKSPVWTSAGANVISTAKSTGEGTLNFTVSFTTTAENYEVFFSIRPFVRYVDESVVYGSSYSNTSSYFDAEDVEYKDRINLLMIGDSFATYYLDEMVQIAKADDIHLTVVRSYKSGASIYEDWTFLINDFKSDQYEVLTRKVCSPEYPNTLNSGYYTLKEILSYADWDYISAQDGYDAMETDGGIYVDVKYDDAMAAAVHGSKLFRYLEVNYPKAELYLHQTWAFQLGWGYANGTAVVENGKVVGGTVKSGYEGEGRRMENLEMQAFQHEVISQVCQRFSELTGVPLIPSGDAWAIARQNPIIGDTLCDKDGGGDYYHEGDIGGGQYLNAAVYYEVITGNDVRGNTWRPSYNISDEKILALQEAAHEAVLAVYGPDHYTK